MPKVVVVNGVIQCTHGGQVRLTTGENRLKVDNKATLVQGQEVGLSFAPGAPGIVAPCSFTTPGGSPSPCSATQAAVAGVSTQLTIGGLGAILETATGVATNTPPATWSIQNAGQSKFDISR